MRLQKPSRRGGFALPVAVLALVVVGVLVTGGFFMAQQETRVGVASQNASMAFYIAEQGMNEVMANWAAARYSAITLWGADTVTGNITQGEYAVFVHRLTPLMYFLESEGTVTQGGRLAGATRKMGLLARIQTAWINPPGALTTRGTTNIRGTALVNGIDANPATWTTCSGTLDDRPGVITDATGTITESGAAQILGNPDTLRDPAIADSTFLDYGDLMWDDLLQLAQDDGNDVTSLGGTLTPRPSVVGSECNTADKLNWGEPWRSIAEGAAYKEPCTGYFPLIYHQGDLTLTGNGRGQGILLVGERLANGTMDGDLIMAGNMDWAGIIITLGQYEARAGQSPRIRGGVMAANAIVGDPQDVVGGSVTQYSSCAIEQAILNNANLAKARPIANRSWVDLTNTRR